MTEQRVEEVTYEERLVLFADILGFKDLVKSSGNNDVDALSKVQRIMGILAKLNQDENSALRTDHRTGNDPQDYHNAVITSFSDHIVVSVPKGRPDAVCWLLRTAYIMAYQLMEEGVLCRGGIALGKLYHTKQYIFGTAFLDAYELEQDESRYPRILFSKGAADRLSL
jgi:hypothetical protein